jgi:excisionase family DNA binding protein
MKIYLEPQDIDAIAQKIIELLKPFLVVKEEPKVTPPPKPEGGYMTASQVSEYLQVSKHTIYNWIFQRRIPYFKMGRGVRFKRDDIEQWSEGKKVKASYDK